MKIEKSQTRTRKGASGGYGGYFRVRIFEDLLIAAVVALKTDPRPLLGAKTVLVLALAWALPKESIIIAGLRNARPRIAVQ